MLGQVVLGIVLVIIFFALVECESCREAGLCCTGHNRTCHSRTGHTDHCFCDDACQELGDCCGDFLFTCVNRVKSYQVRRKRRSAGMKCAPVDLMFVMDESGSVGFANYKKMLRFVRDLLRNFKIGPSDMRVAMIKFGFYADLVFNFYNYVTFLDIRHTLQNMESNYAGGGTDTAAGLRQAQIITRYSRPNAAKAAIVLTDGHSNNWKATIDEAGSLQRTDTKVFCVGIGRFVNLTELRIIASDPDSNYLVTTIDFNDLYNKLQHFINGLCEDIDECQSSPCANGLCINTVGSYHCNCFTGWTSLHCDKDIDECTDKPIYPCIHGDCANSPGSFTCNCKTGFTGDDCSKDIDECLSNPCQHGVCQNTPGSYQCSCNNGWIGKHCDGDIDECLTSPSVCCNGDCTNTAGSFFCGCQPGWTGSICEKDINECNSLPCENDGVCVNLPGYFLCRCRDGFSGALCQNDIDECKQNICGLNGTCSNTTGSYFCHCNDGVTGQKCDQDFEECENETCQNGGYCINLVRGNDCVCTSGYNGTNCELDINECTVGGCANNGTCINNNGSFECHCTKFFRGEYCEEDVNECIENPGICLNGGKCENLCGNYKCHCPKGHQGIHCGEDIDECVAFQPCKNGGNCTNTMGSFVCTCTSNWTGAVCTEDVDECRQYQYPGNPVCNNGDCYNFDGGYRCICHTGYTGPRCDTDITECRLEPCKNSGSCVDIPGSYYCNCVNDWDGPLCENDLCKTNPTKLIFVIDSSYSSEGETFRKQLQYITDIVSRNTVSKSKFSVAVISYGTEATLDIDFDSYENKTTLLSLIKNISFVNGTTNIASACIEVKKILTLAPSAFQFVFFFTDGMPSSLSAAVSSISELRNVLKRSNEWNDIFLVAFGDDVRHEGFRQLSGDHRFGDVYPSINMEPLHQVYKRTVNIRCSACKVRRDSDIVFALDTSTIQSQTTYKASLGIFIQLLQSMDEFVFLGSEYVQMGTVHYSDTAVSFLPLNFTTDLDTFASTFQASKQDNRNSSSNLANALRFIRQEMFSTRQGARDNALKYVVFVDNGLDIKMTETVSLVEKMTKDGISLISIGVGENYKHKQVLNTASSPFHAYFSEQDPSTNQWTLQETEFEFIKKLINSRLKCTSRVNA